MLFFLTTIKHCCSYNEIAGETIPAVGKCTRHFHALSIHARNLGQLQLGCSGTSQVMS